MSSFEYYLWLDGSSKFWLRDESVYTRVRPPLGICTAEFLPHTIILKSTRFVDTRIQIEVLEEPLAESIEKWNKVLSGTISFPSGRLVLEGLGDPEEAHRIDVKLGVYAVNVYYATLAALSEIEIEEQLESYRFEFFQVA